MEHLLTVYIRTKKLCGDKDNTSNDGTIKLSRQELSKLGQELDMDLDGINDKLIELKWKGEIKGYGNNFKVLKQGGITQPSLLEITGEKKTRGRQTSIKATQYVKRTQEGSGGQKFKRILVLQAYGWACEETWLR